MPRLLRLSAVASLLTLGMFGTLHYRPQEERVVEAPPPRPSYSEPVRPSCPEPARHIPPGKLVRAVVTAYTPYRESTGRDPDHPLFNRVAWWPRLGGGGTCAADTRYYPFGTVLYIEGLGFCVVADRGGAIRGPARLDYYMPGPEEVAVRAARTWGKREVWVEVLGRVP